MNTPAKKTRANPYDRVNYVQKINEKFFRDIYNTSYNGCEADGTICAAARKKNRWPALDAVKIKRFMELLFSSADSVVPISPSIVRIVVFLLIIQHYNLIGCTHAYKQIIVQHNEQFIY